MDLKFESWRHSEMCAYLSIFFKICTMIFELTGFPFNFRTVVLKLTSLTVYVVTLYKKLVYEEDQGHPQVCEHLVKVPIKPVSSVGEELA